MMPTEAQIHRFCDRVALSFLGVPGPTIYIDAATARKIAAAINSCADDIEHGAPFGRSGFAPVSTHGNITTKG